MKHLLFVAFLLAAATAFADPCPNGGTMAQYLSLGAAGCDAGTQHYSDFAWSESHGLDLSTVRVFSDHGLNVQLGSGGTWIAQNEVYHLTLSFHAPVDDPRAILTVLWFPDGPGVSLQQHLSSVLLDAGATPPLYGFTVNVDAFGSPGHGLQLTNVEVQMAPEPTTLTLLASGAAALLWPRRRSIRRPLDRG